jgi:nitrogen fixation protein NifU and related proteins
MGDLSELYQEVIVEHARSPRNRRRPASANRRAEGHNPLCGDHVTVYAQVEDGVVRDVAFEGGGCAVSTASASLMTGALKDKTLGEASELFERFVKLVTGELPVDAPGLGKLAVFAGVREFPVRVKCASLPWHSAMAALKDAQTPVTTE